MLRFLYFLFLSVSFFVKPSFAQTEFRLGVEVRDKSTKRPLVPIVSILEINTESELPGQMINDGYVVKVKAGTQYQVFVALEEYKSYRQTLTFDQNTTAINGIHPYVIELESVKSPKTAAVASTSDHKVGHTILVIDKNQRAIVTQAVIILKENRTGEFIPVKRNPNVGGSWLAELKEGEQYTIEVSAPGGYDAYKEVIKVRANEGIEIPLNRTLKQELQFKAVDALTNKPIAAQFKLTDQVKESYTGSTNAEGSVFAPTVIVQKQNYLLTVIANGYRKHESKIAVPETLPAGQAPQIIQLSKTDVALKIKILDGQTAQALPATLRIIDQDEKRAVLNVNNTANGQAALNPNHHYLIEAEAKGFMPYQQPLEKALPTLSEAGELIIKLVKIGDTYLNLSAVDANTGKLIAATYKITDALTKQTAELKGTATSSPVKHKISEPDIYHIETVAVGYASTQYDLDAEEIAVGQAFNYEAKLIPEPAKPAAPVAKDFTFKVFDAQTQKAIPNLRFKITNQDSKRTVPIKIRAAEVQANLQIDQTYLIEAVANGYETATMMLQTVEWAKRGEFLTNISLLPVKKSAIVRPKPVVNEKIFDNIKAGQSLTIEDNVYFDQSSYILRIEAHSQLNRLAAIMTRNSDIHIEIVGHTDNIGDPRLNQILSEQRAKVIANYLRNQGVIEVNITHRGDGQSKPLAPNDSEENRQRNRRVQFLIK